MPQKKINSFFNAHGNTGNMNPAVNYQTNVKSSAARPIYWNSQGYPPTQALQRYHNSRKKQKNMQATEQALFQNMLTTPNNSQFIPNSQISDDSQKFPSSSQSQSQEITRNQRPYPSVGNSASFSLNKSISSVHLPTSGGDYNCVDGNVKNEFKQCWQSHLQAEKENEEREMLYNFLLSAKQCCEEANEISKRVENSMGNSALDIITKMKECLETTVPCLLQRIVENNNEKHAAFQTKLTQIENEVKKRDEQIAGMERKLLENIESKGDHCTNEIVKTINQTNHNSQKTIEGLVGEIRMNFNKPKPLRFEMASQYSPQLQISIKPSREETADVLKDFKNKIFHDPTENNKGNVHPQSNHSPKSTFPLMSPTPRRRQSTRKFKQLSQSPLTQSEKSKDTCTYKSPKVTSYRGQVQKGTTRNKKSDHATVRQDSNDGTWSGQENECSLMQKPKKRKQTHKRKRQPTAAKTVRHHVQQDVHNFGGSGSCVFAKKKQDRTDKWNIFDDSDIQDTRDSSNENDDLTTLFGHGDYNVSWIIGRSSDSEESDCAYTFHATNMDTINLRRN